MTEPTKPVRKHPGTFEHRRDHWRLTLYVGGKRHRFRIDTDDRKAREKFAREKLRELEAEHDKRKSGAADPSRFSALLAGYRRDELPLKSEGTRSAYEDSLKMITEYFIDLQHDPMIDAVQAKHVRAFLTWRRNQRRAGQGGTPTKEPVSNRTLAKDRAVLHRLFAYADALELRDGNPVARVEAPIADERAPILLTPEQIEALLAKCAGKPQLWLYALLLNETGARCQSEALHIRFEDVDLAEGFIRIMSGRDRHRTKSGKSRFVPMTPRLATAMRDHFARTRLVTYHGKQTPWVFHHERDRRGCKAGQRVNSLRYSLVAAAKAAGVPAGFHFHDLRHRRVTTWLAAGGNPVHVKEAMGHSDLRTTMSYTHLSKEHLRSLATLGAVAGAITPQKVADGSKGA